MPGNRGARFPGRASDRGRKRAPRAARKPRRRAHAFASPAAASQCPPRRHPRNTDRVTPTFADNRRQPPTTADSRKQLPHAGGEMAPACRVRTAV
ncbi:unnamed protein product, partial [Iphiclides podalirius]